MTLTTLRGFAARNSWNPGYAHKLKQAGRLVLVEQDGKVLVDVEASMQRLADTADPQKDYMRDVNARQRGDDPREAADPAPVDTHSASYSRARTASTVLDAQLKQLELQTKKGLLLDLHTAKRVAFTAFRSLRDAILNVPVRVKDQCAAEADAFKVEQMIEAELQAALEDFDPERAVHEVNDDEAFDEDR